MTSQEYLAKIFRTKTEVIAEMEKKMEKITGKVGVVDNLMKENEHRVARTLDFLKCHDYRAENILRALITKIQKDDRALYDLFKRPSGTTTEGLKTLFNFAMELVNPKELFVLKKEKAEEILRKYPPPNIMKTLGHENIEELLGKEDLFEVFAALRFVESNEWMHKAFDETYINLMPDDFEKRKVNLRVLSPKWLKIAEKFVKKKYHNISHLKELGVIFVIPFKIDTPGETLRLFSLVLHYLHEVEFYSKLFEKAAKENKEKFGKKLISLLKGEVFEIKEKKNQEMNWMIIQRYLAKDNENDPRLFIPHISPEAMHWQRAEQDMSNLGKRFEEIDLEIWLDVDWAGGFFKNKKTGDQLISFDLVDNVMALVQKEQKIKYLYHHQEALWNKIFEEYMGFEKMEQLMTENFDKGFIKI